MRELRSGRNLIRSACLLALVVAAATAHSDDAVPAVAAVTFHASPAKGATYERGERVQVEVRFDRAVRAAGSPKVALTVGMQTRRATYSGWGDQSLYFDYTVQEQDRDEDGISIAANALLLDGGTIRAADGATDADLTHGAVAASSGNKVNGSLASPPVVKTISFFSPARGDTYERGETIASRRVPPSGDRERQSPVGADHRNADAPRGLLHVVARRSVSAVQLRGAGG